MKGNWFYEWQAGPLIVLFRHDKKMPITHGWHMGDLVFRYDTAWKFPCTWHITIGSVTLMYSRNMGIPIGFWTHQRWSKGRWFILWKGVKHGSNP